MTLRRVAVTLEPFDQGHLSVGDGHRLYYEQIGNPDGAPVVYLHGGPGSGCTPGARAYFNPQRHRAVLFDQRGAGRSTPHASGDDLDWDTIDMDHHVADIERLRSHLTIRRWTAFGISWGSVLGATYAERHPDRVNALVLAAVSTGTADDIDWLTTSMGRIYPQEWHEFQQHVPAEMRHQRLVDSYNSLLLEDDPAIRQAAATAWCRWEEAVVGDGGGAWSNNRYADPAFRLAFARQVTHCWRHDSWLEPNEIIEHAHRLAGIPGSLIHGQQDLSAPLDAPWRLHRAWAGSELVVVEDEGHGGEHMARHWSAALERLALT